MKNLFLLLLLFVFTIKAEAADITISAPPHSDKIQFALSKLKKALADKGDVLIIKPFGEKAQIMVLTTDKTIKVEGFSLKRENGILKINGGDERGAMYGILDLAQQVRFGAALGGIQDKKEEPGTEFRAVKFNLPYMAYRPEESIVQHDLTCRDLRFWEKYLDNMAENRFNVLSLWSLHLFHYMVKPKSFPEASHFTDYELGEWQKFWRKLFRMAHERGIETYIINWNTFVPPSFARAHNVGVYEYDRLYHIGSRGDTSRITEQYTREVIRQVIDEYPDLDGLGITLGERMGGQAPSERRAWLERTVFAGMRDARRKIKFVYRAPLSAGETSAGTTSAENDRLTREQVDGLDVKAAYVEFKHNWSHGHSSPNLFIVHGGKLSDAYWNPVSNKFKVAWTMRNEDFHVLRWGQPDFIREFLKNNEKAYFGGCFVGSEVFIPANDYVGLDGSHKNWTYHFERQWLMYAVWGRLLYNPTTPDSHFENLLAERFGKNSGGDLLKAWKGASRVPLLFASFHQGTIDLALYTEGFCRWREHDPEPIFFDVNEFITHKVLDTMRFVNIADFVNNKIPKGVMTPLQLADSLERTHTMCIGLIKKIKTLSPPSATLDCELADIEAWAWYAQYTAYKIRGATALAQYRLTNDAEKQKASVNWLEKGVQSWKNYVQTVGRYNKEEYLFHTDLPFSLKAMIPYAEKDVLIAKGIEKEAFTNFTKLFNGLDFTGFYTFFPEHGKNKDPKKVFTIEKDSSIRASGEAFGYFCTTDTFINFHLKFQFKWGEKKYAPRLDKPRDAGVIYHFQSHQKDEIWPVSLEFQIQEGDCGDFWLTGGTTIEVDGVRTIPKRWERVVKKMDTEKPHGQWNTVEVITRNGFCVHRINGRVVNRGAAASVQSGRILFQSEGAEVFYKDIQIRKL